VARTSAFGAVVVPAAILAGCQRAPSIDILGSFFPIWIFCIGAGILITIGVRFALVRLDVDRYVGPGLLVYPSMSALFACLLWLAFFR
jgi:hypothetical protein